MALPNRIKYEGEARKLTFNFTSKLATGDALTGSATVSASPGITVGVPSSDLATGLVTVLVSGGQINSEYTVRCQHDTVNGETLILTVTVEVQDDVN